MHVRDVVIVNVLFVEKIGTVFIKTKKQDPVAKHFYTDNHSFQDFQITAIDFIPHADTHTLCNKETFYIKLFKTIQPFGINSHSQNTYPIANYWLIYLQNRII